MIQNIKLAVTLIGLLFAINLTAQEKSGTCKLTGQLVADENSKQVEWSLYVMDTSGNKQTVFNEISSNLKVDEEIEYSGFCIATLRAYNKAKDNQWINVTTVLISGNKELNIQAVTEDQKIKIDLGKIKSDATRDLINYSGMIFDEAREMNKVQLPKEEYGKLADFYLEEADQFISERPQMDEELKEYILFQSKVDYVSAKQSLSMRYSRAFRTYPPEHITKSKYDLVEVFNSPYANVFPRTGYILYGYYRSHKSIEGNTPKERKISMYKLIKSELDDTKLQQKLIEQDLGYYSGSIRDLNNLDQHLMDYKEMLSYLDDEGKRQELYHKLESIRYASPGAMAPDYSMVDVKGNEVKLSSVFDGKNYVYIDMWASWCGPCRAEIPALKKLEEAYEGKSIKFVGISSDRSEKAWHKAVEQEGLHNLQLLDKDNKLGTSLQVSGIPRFVLYSPEGKLVNINAPRPSSQSIKALLDKYVK